MKIMFTQTLHVYIATIILCPIITYSGFYLDMDNSGNEILEFLFRYGPSMTQQLS